MNAKTVGESAALERRWDIDWLRVLVILLLVPYHTARIFDHDLFYVKNGQLTSVFSYGLVRLGDAFAMRLLLFLSGAATWFALRRRSGGRYALERLQRLLVPFVWGLLVLAPPNAYFARRIHAGYEGSYIQFYPRFFEVGPGGVFLDFAGSFTMAHLWFILILFVLSLVALPLCLLLRRESGKRLIARLAAFFALPGTILLLAIPPAIADWLFVRSANPLYPILLLLIFFIYGYVLIADDRFGEALDRHKLVALIVGPVLYFVLGVTRIRDAMPEWLQFLYYHAILPWFVIVALLGYGKRYLDVTPRRGSVGAAFLMYFGEGAYAFYLLHQPVLVTVGYYVVQWRIPSALGAGGDILVKYVTIAAVTFVVTTLLYELLVRRIGVIRFLFGMKPRGRTLFTRKEG
jgi:peptidoglycan/LPS O-acetylase OafA/YrhL